MRILLVRHGEIPSNLEKVYAGRSPEELTEKGIEQAIDVSRRLRTVEIHRLYTSPIQRAVQTAGIIGERTGLRPVIRDEFRELEMGPWEGQSEADIAADYPESWKTWNTDPAALKLRGRETLDELLRRILAGLRDIYRSDFDRTVVIVTHVAVIRVLLLWSEKKSLNLYKTIHVPNAEVFEIEVDSDPGI